MNSQLVNDIISLLEQAGGSLRLLDISKSLHLKSDSKDYEALVEQLNVLVEQSILTKSARRRYSLNTITYDDGLTGILVVDNSYTKKAWVETQSEEYPIVYIASNRINGALSGDKVKVHLIANKSKNKNKHKGEVVEIVEHNATIISGSIVCSDSEYYLIPEDKTIDTDYYISKENLCGARHGDKVIAEIISWEDSNNGPILKVKQVLGRRGDPIREYEKILQEFSLPSDFPINVKNEVKQIKKPVNRKVKDRLDLRKEKIITIDPVTANDFDDALSLTRLDNGNYMLGVHIADVSHYVKENSAIDQEAYKRGNSTYLSHKVVPMLPEELSNEICSLNPDEIRYTFSVLLELNSDLETVSYQISPSMIKSCHRFNYDEVQNIIDTGEGEEKELILFLASITSKLRKKRMLAGSIDYDSSEIKYILDENYYPVDVDIHKTTEATSLVEECMLLANKQVAIHLKKLSKVIEPSEGLTSKDISNANDFNMLPFIYRVHDAPKQEALQEALARLKVFGVRHKSANITPALLNEILKQVKYTQENSVVNQVLIKAMPRAVYSATNIGHFGLGFADYTHFTSPIRRYADLIVHRLLKEYENGTKISKINILRKEVAIIATHISATERASVEAERASTKLTSAIYAKTKLGEIFDGIISGVVAWGFYVVLDGIYCEGLVNIRVLRDDSYIFDCHKLQLIGKKHNHIYSLGMRVRVKITKVVVEKRQIDIELVYNE